MCISTFSTCFRTAGLSKLRSLRFNAVPTKDRMRSDKPSGEPPLCDLCGWRVEDDRLPRGCKPDYVGHLYTCTHVDAVSLRELIEVSRSALKQLSDQQVHVECCNAELGFSLSSLARAPWPGTPQGG